MYIELEQLFILNNLLALAVAANRKVQVSFTDWNTLEGFKCQSCYILAMNVFFIFLIYTLVYNYKPAFNLL